MQDACHVRRMLRNSRCTYSITIQTYVPRTCTHHIGCTVLGLKVISKDQEQDNKHNEVLVLLTS